MKLRNNLFRVGLAFVLIAILSTQAVSQGTSGAASLNITPGARADAMGRAHVALVDDATANWWNPAALALASPKFMGTLMHTQLVPDLADDVYFEYLAGSMQTEGFAVGASLTFLTYGKSIATDEQGNERGTFSSYEISPAVSGAASVLSALSVGMTLKYVYVSLAPKQYTLDGQAGTGDTFAVDFGGLFDLSGLVKDFPIGVRVGGMFQNLGPNISFIDADQSDPIGRNFKLGVGAWKELGEMIVVRGEMDFNKSMIYWDERAIWNTGAEGSLILNPIVLSGRLGYIYDRDGDIRDFSFGGGFALVNTSDLGGSLDIAIVPQARDLDMVTKISITGWFN